MWTIVEIYVPYTSLILYNIEDLFGNWVGARSGLYPRFRAFFRGIQLSATGNLISGESSGDFQAVRRSLGVFASSEKNIKYQPASRFHTPSSVISIIHQSCSACELPVGCHVPLTYALSANNCVMNLPTHQILTPAAALLVFHKVF